MKRSAVLSFVAACAFCAPALADDQSSQSASATGEGVAINVGGDLTINDLGALRAALGPELRRALEKYTDDENEQLEVLRGLLSANESKRADADATTHAKLDALRASIAEWATTYEKVMERLEGKVLAEVREMLRHGDLAAAKKALETPPMRIAANWTLWTGVVVAALGATTAITFRVMGNSAVDNFAGDCPEPCTTEQRRETVRASNVRTYDAIVKGSLVATGVGGAAVVVGLVLRTLSEDNEAPVAQLSMVPGGLAIAGSF